MQQYRVEVDFYRSNFKELTKVTTERKIRYYDESYTEILPRLDRLMHERGQVVAYWKQWYDQHRDMYSERRMLAVRPKKLREGKRRGHSCGSRFSYVRESERRVCRDVNRENAIMSFINETHHLQSMLGCTFDEKLQHSVLEKELFDGDISIIGRPCNLMRKAQSPRKEMIL
jgi:hypothetical protein